MNSHTTYKSQLAAIAYLAAKKPSKFAVKNYFVEGNIFGKIQGSKIAYSEKKIHFLELLEKIDSHTINVVHRIMVI